MKKILTIMGTRPDIIRLSEISKKIDKFYNHIIIHTGQNFDVNLHDNIYRDLKLRQPDYQLNIKEKSVGFDFIGNMFKQVPQILLDEKPDAILILGDVNSALTAYVAKQLHIPILHLEAGNRCYDDNVPEEVNRRIIDSCSTYLLTYTQRSREQLLIEGYKPDKIIVIGNPIGEVLSRHLDNITDKSAILNKFKVKEKSYILATLHRTENITNKENLKKILSALNKLSVNKKVLLSLHPKLSSMLKKFNFKLNKNIITYPPFGFTDFSVLMAKAHLVVTDSGTVPEECNILKVPCVLMRTSTERPELLENNSMVMSGIETDDIIRASILAAQLPVGPEPDSYNEIVSDKIVKILAKKI